MAFTVQRLAISDVVLVTTRAFADARGFFMEAFKGSEFSALGLPDHFVQDNHSYSRQGVLRGLHYQLEPAAQGKFVMAARGEVFDVAVDLRRGSPTYGKWVGATLSDVNHAMLWVPQGFAHGFYVMSEEAYVVYKVTHEYAPDLDRGIRWNDPDIGVSWPGTAPVLSEKDARAPLLREAEINFRYEG